jgi:signal transduction histidine kinase/HAMP domain-containing protein
VYRSTSLRFRLLLLVLIAIIPVLGLTLYTAAEGRQRETSRLQTTAMRMAQIISDEEQELIKGTRQLLVALAHLPAVRGGDSSTCRTLLADLIAHYNRYANLGVADPDGNLFCSAVPASAPVNVAGSLYFQRAVATHDFVVGDYQLDPVTHKPTIGLAYPVLDEAGQLRGVVFATLDLDWFSQLELDVTVQLPARSTLINIDSQGVVLIDVPDAEKWVGQSIRELPLIQTVFDRGQGVVSGVGPGGVAGIYAFAPISTILHTSSIYVIVGFPNDVVFGNVNRTLVRNLVGLGLVTVLALVTASVWGNAFILRPVGALLRAAKRLSKGDLGARTGIPFGQGEVAQLAQAFDQMAEALEQRQAERRRAEATLRQYADWLQMLHRMDSAILTAQSPEAIAQVVVDQIRELVPCVWTSVVTFDPETSAARTLAVCTQGEHQAGPEKGVALGQAPPLGIFGDLEELRQGKVHAVEDVSSLDQRPVVMQALQARGVRSYINLPLISRGRLIGSLNLGMDRPGAFTPEHVEVAREIADSLAVAVQNARLLEEVRAGHEQLQALSRRLLSAQEAERRRIARELHDEIGQVLTAVKMNLRAAQFHLAGSALASDLEESIAAVERTLQQVRDLSLDLHPSLLDDLGLVPALRWLVARQAQQAGLSVQFAADPLDHRLSPDLEITCFRLVQEALTNVVRHAHAHQVYVELRHGDDEMQLTVRDDGVGFDVQPVLESAMRGASLGLLGMRERVLLAGGQIDIASAPGRGTEIRVRFPMDGREELR